MRDGLATREKDAPHRHNTSTAQQKAHLRRFNRPRDKISGTFFLRRRHRLLVWSLTVLPAQFIEMASINTLQPYGHLLRSGNVGTHPLPLWDLTYLTSATARTGGVSAGANFVPRRTLTSSLSGRAQEESGNQTQEHEQQRRQQQQQQPDQNQSQSRSRYSPLSSIKNFFLGRKNPDEPAAKPKVTRTQSAPHKREGSLSADSIFAEDEAAPKLTHKGRTPKVQRPAEGAEETKQEEGKESSPRSRLEEQPWENLQMALDPNPTARRRWERKMIIREIRQRGRLSKAEHILRTERHSTSKSHWIKTSIKKLNPLANQIAGKNVDEAILQMRYSDKKVSKDVRELLEHARNEAVARMGMGMQQDHGLTPITVTLKTGQRKKITNPTAIYIDQAWVNRGPFDKASNHRARGRIEMLRLPYTSISVLLKEERTRIREWQDREAAEKRRRVTKLWTPLPDRKIYHQNQYFSW